MLILPHSVSRTQNYGVAIQSSAIVDHSRGIKNEFESSRERIGKQIGRVEEMRRTIAKKNVMGIIPDELAKEQLQELESELSDCQQKRALLTTPAEDLKEIISFSTRFLNNLNEWWQAAGIQNRKRLQRFVFPEGLLVEKDGHLRTENNGRLTDSELFFGPTLSSLVPGRGLEPPQAFAR